MNREIKFRVYYKPQNRFLFCNFNSSEAEDYDYETIFKGSSGLYPNKRIGEKIGFLEFIKDNDFVFQQYTGIKDKNNKEIYEGDILKCKGYDGWFDEKGFYYNKIVNFEIQPSGESEIAGFIYISNDREIIGNIFENPELLEKKNT